jgi:outer membrane protein OmpA-like peptidoglycan-associated protein
VRNYFHIVLFSLVLLIVFGCGAPRNLIVLLPDPAGNVGQVTVSNSHGTQILTEARQASAIESVDGPPMTPQKFQDKELKEMFGPVFDAQPSPPVCFILYFEKDSTKLSPGSRKKIPDIIKTIQERNSVDTSIVGHTDTSGKSDYNSNLSFLRANSVCEILVADGVNQEILHTSFHGEKDPLVRTSDNVVEPRNRRVEVTVR